jgi:pyruvate dehydrogenase E1 component beta subunit
MTFGQAVKSALAEEMRRDPRVILMGEDIGHHGGMFQVTKGLFEEFGEDRVIDTPISESGFIGMALGAALTGLKPVVEIMFFDFSLVAMDQILNEIAKTTYMSGGLPVPLVLRTQGGGYKGAAAQHSQMLEALFLHVPGLKVVAPCSASDAAGLLKSAIRDPNPVLFIEHNQLYAKEQEIDATEIPLGKAAVKRAGSQASIFSYSFSLTLSLEAAEQLVKEGIDVEVVDIRTLNPLDFDTVAASVKKTHRALIVHESAARCGFGADLAAQIQEKLFDELDAPILRVTGGDHPLPFAKDMEFASLPTIDKIIAKVKEVLR